MSRPVVVRASKNAQVITRSWVRSHRAEVGREIPRIVTFRSQVHPSTRSRRRRRAGRRPAAGQESHRMLNPRLRDSVLVEVAVKVRQKTTRRRTAA